LFHLKGHHIISYLKAILSNVDTGQTRCGIAGTQLIDSTWRWLEAFIPSQLTAPRTAAQLEMWNEHIRFAQWMRLTSGGDRWKAFCFAAQRYENNSRDEKVLQLKVPLKFITWPPKRILLASIRPLVGGKYWGVAPSEEATTCRRP
jgi:hypothetical protein